MSSKILVLMAFVSVLSGCSKLVSFENTRPVPALESAPPVINPTAVPEVDYPCPAEQTKRWEFTQPTSTLQKMDLLFVVDTSASIWNEHKKIAKQISSFMAGLPADADLHIAILPGHGPWSSHSGRLHSAMGSPKVIRTKGMTHDQIQKSLFSSLACLPFDITPGGGEYLFRSFFRATHGKRLATLKKGGFLRTDAHLSVVFVSDENDICYCPKAHGYSQFPDYVGSVVGQEELGYAMYCTDKKDKEKFSPEHVKKHLTHLKGAGNFTVGTIVHIAKDKVRNHFLSEDSIGHGFLELSALATPKSHNIEITDASYATGLRELAQIGSFGGIFTRFDLGLLTPIEESSLFVTVDQAEVGFEKEVSADEQVTLVLAAAQAGRPGSKILIRACSQVPDRN